MTVKKKDRKPKKIRIDTTKEPYIKRSLKRKHRGESDGIKQTQE